jgi:hypothetical protein
MVATSYSSRDADDHKSLSIDQEQAPET